MRERRPVVLDDEVLVEPLALTGLEDLREVDRARPDVLPVLPRLGLLAVPPRLVLDVVERPPGRVRLEVPVRVLLAVDDPVQVELELDEVRVGLLEQDVVQRLAVRLLVRELEIVVVVEELQVELLARDRAGLVEPGGEELVPLLRVRPRVPREARELLAELLGVLERRPLRVLPAGRDVEVRPVVA